MEPTTAKPAGKAKPGKARPDGLVGVFATLADQHAQVAAMLAQLQQEPATRPVLWPAVRREMVAHEHSEVRELYPVLRQYEETRAFADHHDDEARELDALIGRLDMMNPSSEAWGQVLELLASTMLHHAKEEEEGKMFPVAQRVLGEARAIELDAKVLETKQLLAQMH
jgi:hypothetical protein